MGYSIFLFKRQGFVLKIRIFRRSCMEIILLSIRLELYEGGNIYG